MKLWNRRLSPRIFSLVGGEPAMHPRLTEFVRMSRSNWPAAELRLVTNGLLLHRHPELPAALRDTDTRLCISIHYPPWQYPDKFRPVMDLVESWVASHGIRLECLPAYRTWTRRYNGFGATMQPFNDGHPRQSWETCTAKNCYQLFECRIWKCAPLAYLRLQARKFSLSNDWEPYLSYQPLGPRCSQEELAAFLGKEDEPFCNMCAARPQPLELSFASPIPTAVPPRRLAA
jgi:hypothetical protein